MPVIDAAVQYIARDVDPEHGVVDRDRRRVAVVDVTSGRVPCDLERAYDPFLA